MRVQAVLLSCMAMVPALVQAQTGCESTAFLLLNSVGTTLRVEEAKLKSLPQAEIQTSTHWAKRGTYKGPLLADVIQLVAPGVVTTLNVSTWDNFQAQIPYSDLAKYNVILAMEFDGKPLRLDDWGPLLELAP